MIDEGLTSKLCMYTGSLNEETYDESDAPKGFEAWKKISETYYRGYNLAGWCLLLRKGNILQDLVRRGMKFPCIE